MFKASLAIAISSLMLGQSSVEAITGLEVMQERERRHELPSEESWVKMDLIGKDGKKKTSREMATFSRRKSGMDQRLIKFSAPADIRNVGLLTWEQPDNKEDDQWLFLPASKQIKRIAGSSKKNQFMGTDLAYEDLRPEKLSAFEYTIVKEVTIDKAKCWAITAVPRSRKEKRDSGYSKRMIYVRQDIYFPIKTEYYDRRGKLSKVASCLKLTRVKGNTWRSNLATVHRLKEGTKTILIHKKRELNKAFVDSLFTQGGLRRSISANR